jgi:hypothetical protein
MRQDFRLSQIEIPILDLSARTLRTCRQASSAPNASSPVRASSPTDPVAGFHHFQDFVERQDSPARRYVGHPNHIDKRWRKIKPATLSYQG